MLLLPECLEEVAVEHSSAVASAKIAIIDDEQLNVRLIRRQLEKIGCRFLLGITDPCIALESLADFQPDVVLMDVVMPGLSGIELLEQMRDQSHLRETPVIVLTASHD